MISLLVTLLVGGLIGMIAGAILKKRTSSPFLFSL